MSDDKLRPIIIKKKKVVGGGGHHGGAWKVAYADFVTAMMAFFMLMWLLNATTETQRKGLADYFTPTIAIARVSGGGDGAFGGDSVQVESRLPQSGKGGLIDIPASEISPDNAVSGAEEDEFEKLATGLLGKGGDSLVREMALRHIITKVTDEGLVVEIFDLEDSPLFNDKTGRPEPVLREISKLLSEEFAEVDNRIAITSHTASFPSVIKDNPAWETTTQRAHSMRELMEEDGEDPTRFERITGYGQSKPFSEDPMSFENNRLEVILLRNV